MQCSSVCQDLFSAVEDDHHFGLFRERGCQMSGSRIYCQRYTPVADQAPISAIRNQQRPTVNTIWSVRYCRKFPCADIGSCRHHNTARLSCSNTRTVCGFGHSPVFSAPIMRHSKSGGSYGMPVKWCRGWRWSWFFIATAVIQDDREIFCQCHDPAIFVPARYFRYWCCPLFTISSSLTGVAFWVITTALRFSFNR